MSAKRIKGLGRGIEALIPQNFDSSLLMDESERVQKLFVNDITPNSEQPRKSFDEDALKELASSIERYGILQPLVVTPASGGKYEIIAGERRYRAAQIAGLKQIPAIVRSSKELEKLEIGLIENVQRVDLSPLEQAISILRLHEQFNLEYSDIGKRLGKATTTIQNIVRLIGLPKEAKQALEKNLVTEGHARAILALKDKAKQIELLNLIIKNGWSVREAERFVTAHKTGFRDEKKAQELVKTETSDTKRLGKQLQTHVSIRRMAKGSGRLEIHFKSEEDLGRIIKKLGK